MGNLISTGAEFSPDRIYRYSLWRLWRPGRIVAFVGLNPSTADEKKNDPTVTRCINYAKNWGYAGMVMLNIFALRSTDPKALYNAGDPVGPENDNTLKEVSSNAALTIAAWGSHGTLLGRHKTAMELLANPYCLARTKAGLPRHPLYLKADLKPVPYLIEAYA